LVVSGWWWISRLVRHGTPFLSIQDALLREFYDPVAEPDYVWFVQRFTAWMTRRFWGDFGWFELELGIAFVAAAMLVSILAMAVALAPPRARRGTPSTSVQRTYVAVFGSVVLVLLIMVFVNALGLYLDTGTTQFMQGRYLFAAIVPLGVLIGIGLHGLFDRWVASAMLVAAGVLQIESARLILRNWWAEPTASARRQISAMVAWNQWPIPLVGILSAGVVVSGALAMAGLVAQARAGSAVARSPFG
jgi:hypothetical protein